MIAYADVVAARSLSLLTGGTVSGTIASERDGEGTEVRHAYAYRSNHGSTSARPRLARRHLIRGESGRPGHGLVLPTNRCSVTHAIAPQ